MNQQNPYDSPPPCDRSLPQGADEQVDAGRAAYNVVADVVAGPNLRWKDNLIQAVVIIISIPAGAAIGYFVATDKSLGAFAGGGAGLLVGLFGSGIFLMVWRAMRHVRGKHD